jgi:hypothetical protein
MKFIPALGFNGIFYIYKKRKETEELRTQEH